VQSLFEKVTWAEMLALDEDMLVAMGIGALGARSVLLCPAHPRGARADAALVPLCVHTPMQPQAAQGD
jgi:hypothetical protein